jgi:hypothetical protein
VISWEIGGEGCYMHEDNTREGILYVLQLDNYDILNYYVWG